jgi:hypothetical protein
MSKSFVLTLVLSFLKRERDFAIFSDHTTALIDLDRF